LTPELEGVDTENWEPLLAERAGGKVRVHAPKRGPLRKALDFASQNAREALSRHMAESSHQRDMLEALAARFGLPEVPERIEVYDNSHIMGRHQVGAMIVVGPEGFDKASYRRFNIKYTPVAGDDYGMMREVLSRRFRSAGEGNGDATLPDLVLIDGGLGQLHAAQAVFAELGLTVPLASIAKGPDRNAGREQFFLPGQPPFQRAVNDPLLFFLQRIRDEAHRFAIGSHRKKRAKASLSSELDAIPGIGPGKKKALLLHFGSARDVSQAPLEELMKVPGINRKTAEDIFHYFNG
jgi:excinuclease ABC subunit C